MQRGEKRSAASTPVQGTTGWGGRQRRSPVGGAAYGIPRYKRTSHPHAGVPEIRPPSTCMGPSTRCGAACAELRTMNDKDPNSKPAMRLLTTVLLYVRRATMANL